MKWNPVRARCLPYLYHLYIIEAYLARGETLTAVFERLLCKLPASGGIPDGRRP